MSASVIIGIAIVVGFVGFMLGHTIGYEIGKMDGYREAANYYECKRKSR